MTRIDHVTISRQVDAPVTAVFALLSDPAHHADFDGSGMVVRSLSSGVVTSIGHLFTMGMHNDFLGDYTIENCVVEFEPDRRIAWEPVLASATREEAKSNIGHNFGHRWGYDLVAEHSEATVVTEFFDCSRSSTEWQDDLQEDILGWMPEAIAASLAKIEHLLQPEPR